EWEGTGGGGLTETIPNLQAGQNYLVRLHFCESAWNGPGQRLFNVSINGVTVLSNFDIFQTAGAMFKAVVQEFAATPNGSNQIVIRYAAVTANALASGLQIVPLN